MTALIITEKPSAAKNLGKALGGSSSNFEGTDYVIVSARGHLFELAAPEKQVSGELADQYRRWDVGSLPWDVSQMSFEHVRMKDSSSALSAISKAAKGCDEVVIATDVDPSGEGGLIAGNIILDLSLEQSRKLTRMYFTDEAVSSLQKAFRDRKPLSSVADFDEYKKALFRSKWDFLSIQFTRVATLSAAQHAVLRQGRLKSAMVQLVGDQLKAHHEYVRKPFFENRFRDENEVSYISADEPRFATAEEVDQKYGSSDVVVDSRQNKSTKPPRLLDLSGLSSRLSGKGVKAKDVLSVYQKMYEAQVVSYPRTEDLTITTEQFNELLPLVDSIAAVIDVETSILTERSPRKTHVKDSGAHGANRPGPNVPGSLDEVEQRYGKIGVLIYRELASSFLAMFAKDYVYEAQKGHLKEYPSFIGSASVPKVMGWKQVFTSTDEPDEDENSQGLGTRAEPFVHEGANKRPPQPTMTWLMKQLERREVGTGATRTSTYSDVTSEKAKFPLMKDSRGKITMSDYGDMSYRILPGTKIGDLGVTERVFRQMEEVAAGSADPQALLADVAEMVTHDIEVMATNAEAMRSELGLEAQAQAKEKVTGVWSETGDSVSFTREWGGHRFTDDQVQALLSGEEIEFTGTSAKGNAFGVRGKLGPGTMNGTKYIGFQKTEFVDAKDSSGAPTGMAGVTFTEAEKKKLMEGGTVHRDDFWSSKKKKKFSAGALLDNGKLTFDFAKK